MDNQDRGVQTVLSALDTEAPDARQFRLNSKRPLRGHTIVVVEGGFAKLTTYVDNLRPLDSNRPPGEFFYEGWLVKTRGGRRVLVTTGAFNTDQFGRGQTFYAFDPWDIRGTGIALDEVGEVVITAEVQDGNPAPGRPVLSGAFGKCVFWKQVPEADDGLPAGHTEEPWRHSAGDSEENGLPAAPAAGAPPVVTEEAGKPVTADEPATIEPPRTQIEIADSGVTDINCPPGFLPVATLQLELTSDEKCRSATGAAVFDFRINSLLLTLRGLPNPATFGSEEVTGRTYNAYEAWLRNSGTKETVSLGLCRRIWHDTYRLQKKGDVNLSRFDTIMVTAEDRSGPTTPSGPILLSGAFSVCIPAGAGGRQL